MDSNMKYRATFGLVNGIFCNGNPSDTVEKKPIHRSEYSKSKIYQNGLTIFLHVIKSWLKSFLPGFLHNGVRRGSKVIQVVVAWMGLKNKCWCTLAISW